jgi:hypothetical protein
MRKKYKKLARSALDEPQRALYLKVANMGEHAALRFENGYDSCELYARAHMNFMLVLIVAILAMSAVPV